MKLSVIIPTLNAEKELPALLKALEGQTAAPEEILVVDSESTDRTQEICRASGRVRLLTVRRQDFDHGRTRDEALRQCAGDVVVFLTQDAVPADEKCLEHLIRPLGEAGVAVSAGRQLPRTDATPMEKLVRSFNYPAEGHIRSEEDVARMGIKAFFCSDVCAAYNREIYEKLGGFDFPLKTNEDMFFAARAIRGGYRVAYAADARVVHSHNFSLGEQYRRNRIQGYEIERHRDLLGPVSQESEGKKLVRYVGTGLLKQGRVLSFARFGMDCCARLLGSRAGKKEYLREQHE